jgi:hypothetical protein
MSDSANTLKEVKLKDIPMCFLAESNILNEKAAQNDKCSVE